MSGIGSQVRDRLETALNRHGSRSEFCRKAGISRSVLERWLDSSAEPSLESIEKAAEALEIEPWELIKPGSATDNDLRMRVKNETAAFVRREKELLEMVEASLGIGGRPGMQRFLELASKLDDAGIKHHVSVLEAYLGLRSSKLKK